MRRHGQGRRVAAGPPARLLAACRSLLRLRLRLRPPAPLRASALLLCAARRTHTLHSAPTHPYTHPPIHPYQTTRTDLVYGVATEDMDAMTFGATRVIRHLMAPATQTAAGVQEYVLEATLKACEGRGEVWVWV